MVHALKWALSSITGIAMEGSVRPGRGLLWLSAGYAVLGLLVWMVCGLLGWMCLTYSGSKLFGALCCGGLYWLASWKLLPMSRGGEYLLACLLVRGGADGSYESYRRLALYMGLLVLRGLGILGVAHTLGAGWFLPLILLVGCTVSEAVRQRVSGQEGRASGTRDWGHWHVAWGVSVLGCGLLGGGVPLVLCILGGGLCFTGSFLLARMDVPQLELPALRRIWWTVSELAMLGIGVLSWLL